MDVFPGWKDYTQRLEQNWRSLVKESDTVVIAGDILGNEAGGDGTDFIYPPSARTKKILMKATMTIGGHQK